MTHSPRETTFPNFRPGKRQKTAFSQEEAIVLALGALEFLASDTERLDQLLTATGLSPGDLRARAAEPAFLGGILEYLMANEPLLLKWAATAKLAPEVAGSVRHYLPGGFDAA